MESTVQFQCQNLLPLLIENCNRVDSMTTRATT